MESFSDDDRGQSLEPQSLSSPESTSTWTRIGQTSNQVILYHPPSNLITVRSRASSYSSREGSSEYPGPQSEELDNGRGDSYLDSTITSRLSLIRRATPPPPVPYIPFALNPPGIDQRGVLPVGLAAMVSSTGVTGTNQDRRVILSASPVLGNGQANQVQPLLASGEFQNHDIGRPEGHCPYCNQVLPSNWDWTGSSRGYCRGQEGFGIGRSPSHAKYHRRGGSGGGGKEEGNEVFGAENGDIGQFPALPEGPEREGHSAASQLTGRSINTIGSRSDTVDNYSTFHNSNREANQSPLDGPDSDQRSTFQSVSMSPQSSNGQGLLHSRPYFRILEKSHESGASGASTPVANYRPDGISAASNTSMTSDVTQTGHYGNSTGAQTATVEEEQQDTYVDTPLDSQETKEGGEASNRSVDGYYQRFFIEEKKLGMGAEGSVFLCQHVLDGNYLGQYAVKKIAVGSSKPYLLKMLREVRLLETLRHPNIIPYHHVWIENARFSSFAPPIASLHLLMMYANYGNLDTFVAARCSSPGQESLDMMRSPPSGSSTPPDAEELKRRFKARRMSSKRAEEGREVRNSMNKEKGERNGIRGEDERAIFLLGLHEVESLFGDVVAGLEFLHSNSILHLDLKCSNVLLHMREGDLIPTAMISDFGTSEEMVHSSRARSGFTGTMEYMAPEALVPDRNGHYREMDSKMDIWSLGLILHKLLFFKLPYPEWDSYDELGEQIKAYRGFKTTPAIEAAFKARGFPMEMLDLLEKLLHINPSKRPPVHKVHAALEDIRLRRSHAVRPLEEELTSGSSNSTVLQLSPYRRRLTPPFLESDHQYPPVFREDTSSNLMQDRSGYVGPHASLKLLEESPRAPWGPIYYPIKRLRSVLLADSGKGLKGIIAVLKLIFILPPLRQSSPPPALLWLLIAAAIFDILQNDLNVSVWLLLLHVVCGLVAL